MNKYAYTHSVLILQPVLVDDVPIVFIHLLREIPSRTVAINLNKWNLDAPTRCEMPPGSLL